MSVCKDPSHSCRHQIRSPSCICVAKHSEISWGGGSGQRHHLQGLRDLRGSSWLSFFPFLLGQNRFGWCFNGCEVSLLENSKISRCPDHPAEPWKHITWDVETREVLPSICFLDHSNEGRIFICVYCVLPWSKFPNFLCELTLEENVSYRFRFSTS